MIADIPTKQLISDMEDSHLDIKICYFALSCGIIHHKDGMPVQERIDGNRKIIEVINEELLRRARS